MGIACSGLHLLRVGDRDPFGPILGPDPAQPALVVMKRCGSEPAGVQARAVSGAGDHPDDRAASLAYFAFRPPSVVELAAAIDGRPAVNPAARAPRKMLRRLVCISLLKLL